MPADPVMNGRCAPGRADAEADGSVVSRAYRLLPSKRLPTGDTQVTSWLPFVVRLTMAWVRSNVFLLEELHRVRRVFPGFLTVVLTSSDLPVLVAETSRRFVAFSEPSEVNVYERAMRTQREFRVTSLCRLKLNSIGPKSNDLPAVRNFVL